MPDTEPDQSQDLIEVFELLDDWEDRYRLIIDMGKKLPPLDPSEKTEATRVHGCQATVHLVSNVHPGDPPTIDFIAESDAHIVSGLIAILQKVYSGHSPQYILDYDIEALLEKLQLREHLSPTRRNGLYEMVRRIRELAQAHAPA